MRLDKKTIVAMQEAEIGFLSNVKAPGGGHTIFLDAEEVPEFIEDKDAFAAKHFGVTVNQYHDWVETDGAPRCGAITQKGTRCKNAVRGGIQRTVQEWIELDGEYCPVHGGA